MYTSQSKIICKKITVPSYLSKNAPSRAIRFYLLVPIYNFLLDITVFVILTFRRGILVFNELGRKFLGKFSMSNTYFVVNFCSLCRKCRFEGLHNCTNIVKEYSLKIIKFHTDFNFWMLHR